LILFVCFWFASKRLAGKEWSSLWGALVLSANAGVDEELLEALSFNSSSLL
jgi:hypothetical protein